MITKNAKIYIAGHRGMVGSACWSALESAGYKNLIGKTSSELDLRDQKTVEHFITTEKPDAIIDAAAKVGGIRANSSLPSSFLLENLKIQSNLMEISRIQNVKRLIFLGSSCIYPKFAHQPIDEESLLNGKLEETNQWYAIAKISGLKLCEALRKQYGFDAISLMPTNLYGPNDNYHPRNSHVMASLIKKFTTAKKENLNKVKCWGSGTPRREFMHVDDLGKAALFALENWSPNDEEAPKTKDGGLLTYLNVGTGEDISIKDLAKKISICGL